MIETRGLVRTFGERTVLDDVSFDVPAGMLTGFVGANGAGKTTTMRMIMGILGRTEGEVLWQQRPITAADRRRFGYMPEERGLYPKQKILDQLVYLARLSGLPAAQSREAATAGLERFGLADRSSDRVEKLSLGNQQRVQIIAALLNQPQALILDEPFSGLDPTAVDSMVDLLREETDRGVPVLFSSHQLDLVERLCDRLVVLRDGKVVAQGTVEDLRARGPQRLRLVTDHDASWVRGIAGLDVVQVNGPEALVEVTDLDDAAADAVRRAILTAGLDRGEVRELATLRTPLSEIYREVTA
jgi:ABC-2 type transport system ATP-binding protein